MAMPSFGAVLDTVVGIGTMIAGTGGIVAVMAARFGSPVSRSDARSWATGHFFLNGIGGRSYMGLLLWRIF